MRIAIDGNLMCGKRTGMGTMVYNVLKNWYSTKEYMFILYIPEELDADYMRRLRNNKIEIKILEKSNYFKWEQINLPKEIKKDNIDVLWCPYNTIPVCCSSKIVVTIHDVIYMDMPLKLAPSIYKKLGLIYRKSIVPVAVKKSQKIITVSEFAKRELEKKFVNQKEKIRVIYQGTDVDTNGLDKDEERDFLKKNRISAPYILGFGSLEARKNSLRLIRAFKKILDNSDRNIKLVLFGFRGYNISEEKKYIEKYNLQERIIVLGYVSEAEKVTLYKNSEMFVFPTLAEGFGIPVLEAFINKTPVITSNVTSIPEIAGDSAIMLDPNKEEDITTAILRLLNDSNLKNEMIIKGELQAAKFNWDVSSKKILEEILGVINN